MRLGDAEVFEKFYKGYRPKLWSFIFSVVKDDQTTEEVFNDTMMTVWNKINDFGGRSRLSTWVYTIAYRKGLRERSKLNKVTICEDTETVAKQEDQPDGTIEQGIVRKVLAKALDNLPDAQSSVVRLAYFNEMSYGEISAVLDCPVDTVKTRMFHARRKLKSILGGAMADWA